MDIAGRFNYGWWNEFLLELRTSYRLTEVGRWINKPTNFARPNALKTLSNRTSMTGVYIVYTESIAHGPVQSPNKQKLWTIKTVKSINWNDRQPLIQKTPAKGQHNHTAAILARHTPVKWQHEKKAMSPVQRLLARPDDNIAGLTMSSHDCTKINIIRCSPNGKFEIPSTANGRIFNIGHRPPTTPINKFKLHIQYKVNHLEVYDKT
jgi:hypothetical protein